MSQLTAAQERREFLESQLEEVNQANRLITMRAENAALSKILTVAEEGWGNDWTPTPGNADPHLPAHRAQFMGRGTTMIYDRSEGRFIPFYETESDLRRNRFQNRQLAALTSTFTGVGVALESYTMGGSPDEWNYEAEAKEGFDASDELVSRVTGVIKTFLDDNEWIGGLDREVHNFCREDGETLVSLYPNGWRCRAVRNEIDCLTEPQSTFELDDWIQHDSDTRWEFGVHVQKDPQLKRWDYERPLGYHLQFDDSGQDWDYLPSWPQEFIEDTRCAVHFKRNAPRQVARGVSDYHQLNQDLELEYKIGRNIGHTSALQAAISHVIEHGEGTTATEAANDMAAELLANFTRGVAAAAARTKAGRNVAHHVPGTIIHTDSGTTYKDSPLGGGNASAFIEVGEFLGRRMGSRWNMPDWMVLGNDGAAAFASTLVREAPFVKKIESDQGGFTKQFVRLLWRVIRIAYLAGFFDDVVGSWADLRGSIEIKVKTPVVESRDELAITQRNQMLHESGVITLEDWAIDEGKDPDKVDPEALEKNRKAGAGAFGQQPAPERGQQQPLGA